MKKFLCYVNLSKVICVHVIGKKHSRKHRMVCGLCLMICGVFIAEVVGSANHYLAFVCNTIGYGLHGTGLLPFIEIGEPEE